MRHEDWLIQQLPVGMTEDDFLVRYLTIMQRIATSVMEQVDTLPHAFDPAVAPEPMVQEMARWLGVDWIDSSLDGRLQREIVRTYAELIQWRGTTFGLRRLLEVLTGAPVVIRDTGGVFAEGEAPGGPPHVRIDLTEVSWMHHDDVLRVVRDELPATVTFDLWIGSERIWPDEQLQTAPRAQAPAAATPRGTTSG